MDHILSWNCFVWILSECHLIRYQSNDVTHFTRQRLKDSQTRAWATVERVHRTELNGLSRKTWPCRKCCDAQDQELDPHLFGWDVLHECRWSWHLSLAERPLCWDYSVGEVRLLSDMHRLLPFGLAQELGLHHHPPQSGCPNGQEDLLYVY